MLRPASHESPEVPIEEAPERRCGEARPADPMAPLAVVGTLLVMLGIWILRRPGQLLNAYVWCEEGKFLTRWVNDGWLSAIFADASGYLQLSVSAPLMVGAAIDFDHLPQLDYAFATSIYVATACLLLLPRSWLPLPYRAGMAIAAALVPTNPEVFGVLLYDFWWVTLWPVIMVFWNGPNYVVRVPGLIVAGLSNVAAGAMAPVFAILWFRRRRSEDLVSTLVLAVTFAIQAAVLAGSGRRAQGGSTPFDLLQQVLVNYGEYLTGWLGLTEKIYPELVGALVLIGLLAIVLGRRLRLAPAGPQIQAVLLASIILSVASALPAALATNPYLAGPRYYFLPFVTLAWMLILVVWAAPSRPWKVVAAVLLGASLVTLAPAWSRDQGDLNWGAQVRAACREGNGHPGAVPVYFDGSVETSRIPTFAFTPTRQLCARLAEDSR